LLCWHDSVFPLEISGGQKDLLSVKTPDRGAGFYLPALGSLSVCPKQFVKPFGLIWSQYLADAIVSLRM
jgi:hypothetical protein